MRQVPLFTCLLRPFSQESEVRDLRIAILDNLARQWYGKLTPIETTCHCGEKLYFFYNYLSKTNTAIAYCRKCGWMKEIVL